MTKPLTENCACIHSDARECARRRDNPGEWPVTENANARATTETRTTTTMNRKPLTEKQACEIRPGIGLCDQCGLPKWPQQYMGNGSMICQDCLDDFDRVCKWMTDDDDGEALKGK